MKKLFYCMAYALLLTAFSFNTALAADIGNTQITSKGACVLDCETGRVLYEYNGNNVLIPASMTKVMTMYCIYDAIAAGEISYDTVVPISPNVSGLGAKDPGLTVIPLRADTLYTVDELINMIVVFSANDAALAVAELICGSEQEFVSRMNSAAARLGLDAYFYDCYGLANNEITPVSMAELARRIIIDYPDILTRSSLTEVGFHGGTYKTTNHMLDKFYYEGADGLKTGTTTSAGCCFCGTAVRGGERMIAVTMGSAGNDERFIDAARLLDYGFAAKQDFFSHLYFTDIRTIIDDMQIPTLYHRGDSTPVIIAEELEHYGFDVEYDGSTLTLTRRRGKNYAPIDTAYYRNRAGEPAYDILTDKATAVVLHDGSVTHSFETVYCLNGYTGITVSELGNIYETNWIERTSTENINTENKMDSLLCVCSDNNTEADFSDKKPMIADGKTMIPVRSVADLLGAEIYWDDSIEAYCIAKGESKTLIRPDSLRMIQTDKNISRTVILNDTPRVINGSLCMSAQTLARAMNTDSVWDGSTRTLLLRQRRELPFLCNKTAAAHLCAPLPYIF